MKLHLEPLAIAANVTQTASCRLDTVLLTFGFLVMQYQKLTDIDDLTASTSIISSLEKRWMAADQDIFIATVIVNPFYRADPFSRHLRFIVAGIVELLGRLYARFFAEQPPHNFRTELRDYLTAEGQYSQLHITCATHKIMSKEQVRPIIISSLCPDTQRHPQGKPLNPLEVYRDLSFSSEPLSPFHRLASHLLSICANSATCERLFSVFRNTLTKLRNRMGTSTLTHIAELKMHVRAEHQLNSTRTRMKRMFAARSKTASPDEPPTPSADPQSSSQQPEPTPRNEETTLLTNKDLNDAQRPRSGLREFLSNCNFVPTEDDELPPAMGKMSLKQLFNFNDEHWLTLYEGCARRSYEEELSLYDLLNEDAATGDGMEVDVDETTAEILIG